MHQAAERIKIANAFFKCFAKLKLDEKDFYSICSISKNLSRQNLGVTDHTFISKVDFSFYLFTTNIFE